MRNILLFLLILLASCGSSNQGIQEKDMQDFSFEESDAISEKDSIALNILESNSNSTEVQQPAEEIEPEFILPEYKFSTIPNGTYDISKKTDLLLTIVGKEDADISLSWQDASSNWKTVKNGSKKEEIYTLRYPYDFVKKNIGTGDKRFVAEILFDKDREPVMLEVNLKIIESNIVKKNVDASNNNFNMGARSNIVFDDIYFDYKKWQIPSYKYNSNFSRTINKAVKALKENPNINLILTGYTDQVGSQAYNLVLAKKRCYSIGQIILGNFNISDQSLIKKRLYIFPAGKNDPEADKSNNGQMSRRVSLNLSYSHKGELFSSFDINRPLIVKKDNESVSDKYKQAMKLFYAKNFSEAQLIFFEISENYPEHSLADNAKWWTAEIYYIQKDFHNALQNYNQVFGLGDGNKEAYAQYRIGCCYRELGDIEKAIIALKNVNNLYPDAKEEWQKAQRILVNISK